MAASMIIIATLVFLLAGEHYFQLAASQRPGRLSRRITGAGDSVWSGIGNVVTDGLSGLPSSPITAKEVKYIVRKKTSEGKYTSIMENEFNKDFHLYWDKSADTKVLVHGFTPTVDLRPIERLKSYNISQIANAFYHKDNTTNIIVMNWTSISTHTYLKYSEAVYGVPMAAKDLADLIVYLFDKVKLITDLKRVHLIGFSLGAHVSGGAGFRVLRKTNTTLGRITGVDPAGAQFNVNLMLPENKDNVLNDEDAHFVDIIHCNMSPYFISSPVPDLDFDFGHYGTPARSGHVDFYPEGGISQRGCSYWKNKNGCSHGKCPGIFLATVKGTKKLACPCKNWKTYAAGGCKCTSESGGVWFGYDVDQTKRGMFYLYYP